MWNLVLRFALPIAAASALVAWSLGRRQKLRGWPVQGLRVFAAAWVVAMTGLLSVTLLVYGNHPRTADDVHHFSYNLHGTRVFLTNEEHSALSVFEAMAFGGVAFGLATGVVITRQRRAASDRKFVSPER
jgi:hypothetical protein